MIGQAEPRARPAGSLSGAILRNSAIDETCRVLGICLAGALRVGKPFQILAGEIRGPRRSERPTALRHGPLKQSFSQRRRAQHAHGNARRRIRRK